MDGGASIPRLRDHPLLVGATAGLAAIEAALVVGFGPAGAVALAPQVSAAAPYGVFHDLRWLLVYHPSWQVFVAAFAAFLGLRAALDVALVRAAWPRGATLGAVPLQLGHGLRFTAIVALVLAPFAVLVFAMAVTSLSWLFFVVVPVLAMVAVLVHHGEVTSEWWRDRPTRTSVGAVLLMLLLLTTGGALLSAVPRLLTPFVAAGIGVGVAWCRLRAIHSLVHQSLGAKATVPGAGSERAEPVVAPARRRPFAVVGLVGIVALVVVGTTLGFAVSVAVEAGRNPLARVSVDATGSPVLVVKGFNSKWEGITRRWVRGHHRIRRFSYRGLDAHGRPQPYDRAATHRSLPDLVHEMRRQVDAFRRATGQDVRVVAESEGALLAETYLAATPHAPVAAVVLLSPLLAPGRVSYPPLGENGWGVVSGTLLDGIARALSAVGPVDVSADTPLFRSIVDQGPTLGALLACPPPGLRSYAVLPLDAGVAAPAPADVAYDHEVVPAFHGGLLGDATTAEHVEAVLAGHATPESSSLWAGVGDVVNALAAPWQAPDLEPGLVAAWRHLPGASDCAGVRAELRSWVSRTGSG